MKQHLVVFLRHYNDIDHIIPVAHHILSNKDNATIDIVLTESYQFKSVTEYSFSDDYRITAVGEFANCEVHYLSDIAYDTAERVAESAKNDLLIPRIKSFGRKLPTGLPKRLWDTVTGTTQTTEKNWGIIAQRAYNELIADRDDVTIVFDWVLSRGGKSEFANAMVGLANGDGHRTVSLPHGDSAYVNYWIMNNSLIDDPQFGEIPLPELIWGQAEIDYDYIVVPNSLVHSRRAPHESNRMEILGSPRFNEQWISTLTEIAPDFEPELNDRGWKIVFFSRKPENNVDQRALAEAIRMLAQFDSEPIVVKHHTRTTNDELNRVFREQAGQNIDEVPTVQLVSDDVHSVSLLEWGDVFIDAGTSVIFEAVVRDKPILQLEYSHWNESTVARYLPGTAVKSRDDFYNHLRTINTASTTAELPTTYGSDERVTFINELIYPNGENVLESYAALLLDD